MASGERSQTELHLFTELEVAAGTERRAQHCEMRLKEGPCTKPTKESKSEMAPSELFQILF